MKKWSTHAPLSFTWASAWNIDVHHNKGGGSLFSWYKIIKMAQSEEVWRTCTSPRGLWLLLWMSMEGSSGADQLSDCVLTSKSCNCFGSLQTYRTERHSRYSQTLPWLKYINTPGTRGLSEWSLKEWRSQLGPAANTKPSSQPGAPSVIPSASLLLIDPHSV